MEVNRSYKYGIDDHELTEALKTFDGYSITVDFCDLPRPCIQVSVDNNDPADWLFVIRTHKLPKTPTIDWVVKKVIKTINFLYAKSVFINLKPVIEDVICLGSSWSYFTSFGFSVTTWQRSESFHKQVKELEDELNSKGIEYRNEYSDAFWVYRFIIAKNENNLNKIKQLQRA